MRTEPWVSVEEVSEYLGVTKDTVYRWIEKRGLPAQKIGKLWKFKLSEVEGWARAGGRAKGAERRKRG
jgi:excisionase family DNA binding protein